MKTNNEIRAMSTGELVQYFQDQKKSIEKRLGTNFDSMKTFKLYQKIINDVKSINPNIKVDFSYVSKDTPKGTMKILFTSKKSIKSKPYKIANTFIVNDNKFLKLSEYLASDGSRKPFVLEAGERSVMNVDDTIIKALKASLNNNEDDESSSKSDRRDKH